MYYSFDWQLTYFSLQQHRVRHVVSKHRDWWSQLLMLLAIIINDLLANKRMKLTSQYCQNILIILPLWIRCVAIGSGPVLTLSSGRLGWVVSIECLKEHGPTRPEPMHAKKISVGFNKGRDQTKYIVQHFISCSLSWEIMLVCSYYFH